MIAWVETSKRTVTLTKNLPMVAYYEQAAAIASELGQSVDLVISGDERTSYLVFYHKQEACYMAKSWQTGEISWMGRSSVNDGSENGSTTT